MKRLTLISVIALAGCDKELPLPPVQVTPPEARLMAAPAKLADIPKGAGISELARDDIQCRVAYGRETQKLRLLQEYQTKVRAAP